MFNFITRLRPSKGTLGIEITDYCIKLVQLIITRKQEYIIQSFLIEKLPDNTVVDGRIKDPSHVILVIKSMIAKLDIKTKKVHIVLPSELIMVRFLKLPDISNKDLTKLVDFEMKHNIHLPFDLPIYDFTKLNGNEEGSLKPVKTKTKVKPNAIKQAAITREETASALSEFDQLFAGQEEILEDKDLLQCDVMLVAAPKELITEYEDVFTAASLQPLSMEFKALSLFRVMEHSNIVSKNNTILIIDINDHLSDLSIFHNGHLKITRSIPLVFSSSTKDRKVVEEKDMFSPIINEDSDFKFVCNDLAYEIERLMNFYRYTLNNREHEFSLLLIAGDVPRLKDIMEIISGRLTFKISIMTSEGFKSTFPFSELDEVFPSIAVPIGLTLRGNKR